MSITSNRRKSQSSKVKCKPLPPPRRRSNEKEDKVSDSGDDGLEMKDLVAIMEEDESKYYLKTTPLQAVRYMLSSLHDVLQRLVLVT